MQRRRLDNKSSGERPPCRACGELVRNANSGGKKESLIILRTRIRVRLNCDLVAKQRSGCLATLVGSPAE